MKTNPNDSIDRQVDVDGYVREVGLTKREHFASMMLQAKIANNKSYGSLTEFVDYAVTAADKLIEKLNETKETP